VDIGCAFSFLFFSDSYTVITLMSLPIGGFWGSGNWVCVGSGGGGGGGGGGDCGIKLQKSV
jgi:hypothetical protein